MQPEDLEALKQFGSDAVSFQSAKVGVRWWRDGDARVAYVETGHSWIAIGTPLTSVESRPAAVQRFIQAARERGFRPVFFGVEDLEPFAGCRSLVLGQQSVLKVSEWDATLRRTPTLRKQVRRPVAKGVTVRQVDPSELAEGMPLRSEVERLRGEWLACRPMEPMGFLVSVEPFHVPAEHLYFVAEHKGKAVQFLSAVPIYGRNGWLMEDMLRSAAAPNGTTELVIDAIMHKLSGAPYWLTPGLTPLAGGIPWWLEFTRRMMVPLYDFSGLRRFRSRLHPASWRPIWMVWDRGPSVRVILDVLRAFASGHIVAFAWRSLTRHPNGLPWAVAVPLVAWTGLLAGLTIARNSATLGFSVMGLAGWTVFDAVIAWLLFTGARKPRPRRLAAVGAAAAFDAILSVRHLSFVGLGSDLLSAVLRLVATVGPVIGTAALTLAWWQAHVQYGPSRRKPAVIR